MATKTPKTKKPTGLSITRNGNDYTFKWKIAAKDHGGGQTLQYAVNGGGWTARAVGVATLTATVTVANVASIRFRIRGKRKGERNDIRKHLVNDLFLEDMFPVVVLVDG